MTKEQEEYCREFEELPGFDEQLRAVCDMKTNVTIQDSTLLSNDGLIHVFHGLRKDPIRFYVEETGAYCFINPEVCLMACRGLIWLTHEMHIDDYQPTPEEARALKAAAAELGFDDVGVIDVHSAAVSIFTMDSISTTETANPIRLH